jgi:hypothetical protein
LLILYCKGFIELLRLETKDRRLENKFYQQRN